ncbi:MAG: hypothetical protein ABFD77_08665 [Thermotogota bacterium]
MELTVVLGLVFPAVIGVLAAIWKAVIDWRNEQRARNQLLEAERYAFKPIPEVAFKTTVKMGAAQEKLEQRTREIADLLDKAQATLTAGGLLDLYNKQIEKYQTETQARAGWSFIFAILAMSAGLGFVIWGGSILFSGAGWKEVAAGSSISAIGGAVSAYITKTFLDVHRLSLGQLNRYFRQPVLNAHILTAQRLADLLDEPDAKRMAYSKIIDSVISLVREGPEETPIPDSTETARGHAATAGEEENATET